MADYIIRATAADGQIRAFASTTRDLVEEARKAHNTSPVATAALGRLLTAGGMMGSMMKGEDDLLTIKIQGDGPMEGLTITADSKGDVKGYVYNPDVMLPPNAKGKLDVGGALCVKRDPGYRLKGAVCRPDHPGNRRDCRRSYVLLCNFRADSIICGFGSADE